MRRTRSADGDPRLTGNGLDVITRWPSYAPGATAIERKWEDKRGVKYAGLPDLYASGQEDNNARRRRKDGDYTAFIRHTLQSPDSRLLPGRVMQSEMKLLLAHLPEHLLVNPKIIRLITENIYTDFTLYGDPRIGRANQIIGTLERARYRVPALYHNGFWLLYELGAMAQRMSRAGFSITEQQDGLIAHSAADNVYGNGRFTNNPNAYDEYLSAVRLEARARRLGLGRSRIGQLHTNVVATEIAEGRVWQRGRNMLGRVEREVAGRDLHILSEPAALKSIWGLVFEDGFSARFDKRRTLGRVAVVGKFWVTSVDEAVRLFGDKLDVRVPGSDQTPREYIGNRLIGNAWFQENYQQPDGYPTHNMIRHLHAEQQIWLGRALLAGRITLADAHEKVEGHTQMMQNMFGTVA